MLKKYFLVLTLLSYSFMGIAQGLTPTDKEGLLILQINDSKNLPVEESITLIGQKSKKVFSGKTDVTGKFELLVPLAETYNLSLNKTKNFTTIEIPQEPYGTFQYNISFDKNKLYPSEKEAVIELTVLNKQKKPLKEQIKLLGKKSNLVFEGTSDELGIFQVLVPIGDTYLVSFNNAPDYDEIIIDNTPLSVMRHVVYFEGSSSQTAHASIYDAIINLFYKDLKSQPIENEEFIIKSLSTDKTYTTLTKKDGKAQTKIPKNDTYSISIKYHQDIKIMTIPKDLGTVNFTCQALSSLEVERRKKEAEELAAQREAEWKALEKKLEPLAQKMKEELTDEGGTFMKNRLRNYTAQEKKAVMELQLWSVPEEDLVVNNVLKRNAHWKNKLIIVDVTGSMRPYDEHLLMWYMLNFKSGDKTQYVLFNDGDNKLQSEKKIGETEGIYYCKYCTPDQLMAKIKEARLAMKTNIDAPENDLEAIIKGIKNADTFTDLILIADNYGGPRDIALLDKIKMPVKVVLCGTTRIPITEDYLDLAYKTRGSVHTIEDDITNISKTMEGQKITIGKREYILQNGKFISIR